MVDLDREVVDLCKEHLPNHHQGSFDDPRVTLLHEDALAYLDQRGEPFDVVIIDVPDPLEGGPAYLLYTVEFYELVRSRLEPGGLMGRSVRPDGPNECPRGLHCHISDDEAGVRPCVGASGERAQLRHNVGFHRLRRR